MNPEVGLVKPENDPEVGKTAWSYDPHLSPELQFDVGRAEIEKLIDDALASGDEQVMKTALLELRRLQEPYLNWTGKAERTSFEIDTVSLHVHERVDPATILDGVKKKLANGQSMAEEQLDFFHPSFEEKPLREALGFYKHDKDWSNRLITGDSLLVMNSLLQKESMRGQVQMIYIDPPYGIKYGSNFQPFTNKRKVEDGKDEDLTQEPEMIKAFRDTWELGLHSYLAYMRDRLLLSRELLSKTGSIFVQISDENLHHIRELMDEVFGPENFVAIINYRSMMPLESGRIESIYDYIIWYFRDSAASPKYRNLLVRKKSGEGSEFKNVALSPTHFRSTTKEELENPEYATEIGGVFKRSDLLSSGYTESCTFDFELFGEEQKKRAKSWRTTFEGVERLKKASRLYKPGAKPYFKMFFNDFGYLSQVNSWHDTIEFETKDYVVQTTRTVIERCLLMTTDPGDLVFDPTCGSGTTAFVAEKWGRRWITCDTSRVAVTLAKRRLMTASFDYYTLRYPHEGLKGGFDYETVPHITLKNIANNPDIDAIYEEDHPKIENALSQLNEALLLSPPNDLTAPQGARKGKRLKFSEGETLFEWEVPFDWPEDWPDTAKEPFEAFHTARRQMQARMDESVASHADQETLYDKPKIDNTKLRVSGKFTVEAVPAPIVMGLDDEKPVEEPDASLARSGETSRQSLWRDELLKTGIRGKGGQMLTFADLEVFPDLRNLHASGSLAESGDRVVISFGPEHAALEQRQVELALQEAEKLRPTPKVVVFCAFTFDPEAAKDIDELDWPGVTLLKAQMNTDLLTEDLKKKRASNQSFWLMGQPDVDLRKLNDGKWEVEVNGFDYFNTKTGELDSGGKGKIAMWSLDTNYNERSLFPHQVFFPMAGAKDGWNRLKKTLRSELDEDLLDQFHGTVSLPFEAGEYEKIAVKIVDDRGIESLKIIPLGG
ncbi:MULTISPECIES: site-specific DNA-methyltransferase [unclassified Ruegeria]|uniref:site-specific DNA-methyltransferase n=1 Tax=unclassified Ruegeria TaxID=2625375 RepID=UPI0020A4EAB6|nr:MULTISPECIES: site-specific DNA-methyltransferase [unclassified Ruegeria]